MDPGQVWFNLLPVFNLLWLIVTVERVGESIRNELVARGRHRRAESYGKTVGITWLVLLELGLFANLVARPAGIILWAFALIYWVVYWGQISAYSRRLRDENAAYMPPADEGW